MPESHLDSWENAGIPGRGSRTGPETNLPPRAIPVAVTGVFSWGKR